MKQWDWLWVPEPPCVIVMYEWVTSPPRPISSTRRQEAHRSWKWATSATDLDPRLTRKPSASFGARKVHPCPPSRPGWVQAETAKNYANSELTSADHSDAAPRWDYLRLL